MRTKLHIKNKLPKPLYFGKEEKEKRNGRRKKFNRA